MPVGGWQAIRPQHHPVVAGICHRQLPIPQNRRMGPAHRHSADILARIFIARRETVLPQDQIGGLTGFQHVIPDQNTPIAGITHDQFVANRTDPIGPMQCRRRRRVRPTIGQNAICLNLPQNEICGSVMARGRGTPDQNTVIPRIRNHQTAAPFRNPGWNVQTEIGRGDLGIAPLVFETRLTNQNVRGSVILSGCL